MRINHQRQKWKNGNQQNTLQVHFLLQATENIHSARHGEHASTDVTELSSSLLTLGQCQLEDRKTKVTGSCKPSFHCDPDWRSLFSASHNFFYFVKTRLSIICVTKYQPDMPYESNVIVCTWVCEAWGRAFCWENPLPPRTCSWVALSPKGPERSNAIIK